MDLYDNYPQTKAIGGTALRSRAVIVIIIIGISKITCLNMATNERWDRTLKLSMIKETVCPQHLFTS